MSLNREIKFRAWDGHRKMMLIGVGLENGQGRWGTVKLAGYPLMQFTGLRDKKGNNIFEGDIVRASFPFSEDPDEIHQIRWSEGCAGFWVGTTWPLTDGFVKDLEVIGNIYENNDLLNQNAPVEKI